MLTYARGNSMKKSLLTIFVVMSLLVLGSTLNSPIFGQSENLEVLSYSWYTSPYYGDLVVVGEVQNKGPNVVDYVFVRCIAYDVNGTAIAEGYNRAFANYLLPQQKAPFYIEINYDVNLTGDFSWVSSVNHIQFLVAIGNTTDVTQYQGLEVKGSTAYINSTGMYTVTGVLQNTGSNTTGKYWVVGTFYNAAGTVVAVGGSEYLQPYPLAPSDIASFTFTPFDSTTQMASQIANYSLLIQNTPPDTTATPSPSTSSNPSPSSSPSPTQQATASPDTQSTQSSSVNYVYLIVLIVALVAGALVVVVFVIKKRR